MIVSVQPLANRRILVVEDEYLIAMDVKRWLIAAGATVVGPVPSADQALSLIAEERLTAAVLDVNVGLGDTAYPVAAVLEDLGVPYVFATGDVKLSDTEGFRHRPLLTKPYLEAVKLCDASIKIESIPSWGNPPRLLNEELVSALKVTRDYLFDQAQMRLMANNPRVLESHETSDPLRAHARSIGAMVRDLFGPFPKDFPHAPVTRIFMVSLNEIGDIDAMKRRVVKWCQAGPAPISITAKGAPPQ